MNLSLVSLECNKLIRKKMNGQFYKYDRDSRDVVTVTLNRPEVHNAFNDELITELITCFKKINEDNSIRLVVLTGEGKSFCAGADLNWMKRMKDYTDQENYDDSLALSNLFSAINNCDVPVIGKINGAALGGGSGLVAVCDYALACKSAKFGFTETRLGLVPAVISPFVMAKIGENYARSYFLSGERFVAPEAMRIGLVHSITPLDNLDTETERLIAHFLKAGPHAAKTAKKLIRNVMKLQNSGKGEDVVDYTCKTIAAIRVGDEAQEGMSALLDKRKPSWIQNEE